MLIRSLKMPPNHNWTIHANGGSNYESLADKLGGNDIALAYKDDCCGIHFFAFSHHIDNLTDIALISNRIFSLEIILNGARRLSSYFDDLYPIRFTGFTDGNQSHEVSPFSFEDTPFRSDLWIDQQATGSKDPKRHQVSQLIQLAKSDDIIKALIIDAGFIRTVDLRDRIMSWNLLYKMIDTIKAGCKRDQINFKDLTSGSDLGRFTASCNNMAVIGHNARHGIKPTKAPTKILTDFEDASLIVFDICSKFLDLSLIHI